MTRIFRILILAALAVVVLPSVPASSAGVTLFCENALDCPIGDFCRIKPGHKTGRCVGSFAASGAAAPTLVCENAFDCPIGKFCKLKPGHNTGRCVSQ